MKTILTLTMLFLIVSCGTRETAYYDPYNDTTYYTSEVYPTWHVHSDSCHHPAPYNNGHTGSYGSAHGSGTGGGYYHLTDKSCDQFTDSMYSNCIKGFESDRRNQWNSYYYY